MSTEALSRIQFALIAAFHYIFPPLSIGLGLILVIFEGLWLKTGDERYERITRFWIKAFSLIFGIGVATGIPLEFAFGMNWSHFSRFVGDVFGSALAAEGLFAFFLESGFLGLLVFGWDRISPRMHFLSTVLVAFGAHFSAIWILIANSWMQTPAGFKIVGTGLAARARVTDFWQVVFNPSSLQRIAHTVTAAWITGAFLVISVSAYYLVKNRHIEFARISMKVALSVAVAASLLQLVTGDFSAREVARYQPAKMAAMEGHFDSARPLGLSLFGYVDTASKSVVGLTVPGGGSFLLTGTFSKPVTGLDSIPRQDRPPIQAVFEGYHLMVLLGLAIVLLSVVSTFKWWRGTIWNCHWLLTILVWSVALPELANQAGWFTAELGRQPWIVYGIERTSEAVSSTLSVAQVVTSLGMYALMYGLLFALFIFLLDRHIRTGPEELSALPPPTGPNPLGELRKLYEIQEELEA